MFPKFHLILLVGAPLLVSGCAMPPQPQNPSGIATRQLDPNSVGMVYGLGIEQQDVVSMSDQMMRDMLANPQLTKKSRPPRVIIDAEYFVNDSTQPINKNIITDRLRNGLNRSAVGRLVFVGRNYAKMVETERDLKRSGVLDIGTAGLTKAQMGGDYRLGGRISTLDSRSPKTGVVQRYTQITFEMIDLESSEIIWSGMYEFSRAGAEDVVYR